MLPGVTGSQLYLQYAPNRVNSRQKVARCWNGWVWADLFRLLDIHAIALQAGSPLTDPATRLRFADRKVCAPFIAALSR
jgi:hypothetical protein